MGVGDDDANQLGGYWEPPSPWPLVAFAVLVLVLAVVLAVAACVVLG